MNNGADDEDDHFDSVSSVGNPAMPRLIPSYESLNQTRLIPCKYAVRGGCQLGEKCLYLHDGKNITFSNVLFVVDLLRGKGFSLFRNVHSIGTRMATSVVGSGKGISFCI